MPGVTKAFEADNDGAANRQQRGQADTEAPVVPANEKELSTRENNVAKIKVVVSCVSLSPWYVPFGAITYLTTKY